MFGKNFQRKYALTDQGVRNTKKGAFWTVIVNLIVMVGIGILYFMMAEFMDTLTNGAPLPGAALPIILVILFVLLSFLTHLQQYKAKMCIRDSLIALDSLFQSRDFGGKLGLFLFVLSVQSGRCV